MGPMKRWLGSTPKCKGDKAPENDIVSKADLLQHSHFRQVCIDFGASGLNLSALAGTYLGCVTQDDMPGRMTP